MKIKRTFSIAIVCVLLVTVFSAVLVYAPPPSDIPSNPFQEVIVANTDPIPVDVTTATTLDVALDEPVEVTGTVEVTNFTERQPFQCEVYLIIQGGTLSDEEYPDVPVPEGKLFVIEYIGAGAYASGLDLVRLDIQTQVGEQRIWHPLGVFEPNGEIITSITKVVKLYSDDSGHLKAKAIQYSNSGQDVNIQVTFSGYLIDAS